MWQGFTKPHTSSWIVNILKYVEKSIRQNKYVRKICVNVCMCACVCHMWAPAIGMNCQRQSLMFGRLLLGDVGEGWESQQLFNKNIDYW